MIIDTCLSRKKTGQDILSGSLKGQCGNLVMATSYYHFKTLWFFFEVCCHHITCVQSNDAIGRPIVAQCNQEAKGNF